MGQDCTKHFHDFIRSGDYEMIGYFGLIHCKEKGAGVKHEF